ncbi:MAG: glutamine synthetase family protein [Lachnospiraceae bacterium]|nr:glutamine synthetase family protein [Lachnospiraceae bacterium]
MNQRTTKKGNADHVSKQQSLIEEIRNRIEEEDIAFIRLQFTDIFGTPKNIAVTASQLDRALAGEVMFEASLVGGYVRSGESDMYLIPDLSTFDIYPWRPQSGKVARLYCDVCTLDRQPFAGDPRQVLARVMREAGEMGLTFDVDPEQEFFLFRCDDNGDPIAETRERAGYFDVAPADWGENVRRDIVLALEDMNFRVSGSYHEMAPAQNEIDFEEERADRIADKIMTFRMAVKTIAKKHGLYATFMPKPREGVNGSGMHLNFKCRDTKGRNLFFDEQDGEQLSDTARQFIAGILRHIRGITLVTNPIVNSYKRLVPGFEAPVHVSWSGSSLNTTAVIRIQALRGDATRIEVRNPDGASNPYLAIALLLAAGMEGIRKGLVLQEESCEGEADEDTDRYATLPETLGEAIEAFRADPWVRDILGDGIYEKYMRVKEQEWRTFRTCVTAWEMKEYLEKY